MFITFVVGILFIMFVNLGRFFDVSEAPQQSDVIVCLGGGGRERVDKAVELYMKQYAQKIILTGSLQFVIGQKYINKISYLLNKGVDKEDIVFLTRTSNTMKEVVRVKEYLLARHLHKALFVSDPPHSRRIMFLAQVIAKYQQNALSCFVVGSDVSWWNRASYYRNKQAVRFVVSETLKLPSNYIAYGVLEPLGLYDMVKEEAGGILRYFKHKIRWILG